VVPRRLYDEGVMLGACESLAPLAPAATVHVNPDDLERIGVPTGGTVRVRSSRAAVELEALADPGISRGAAMIAFNLDSADSSGASALIDSARAVNDVRLETP